jgi:nucleotide-binding universal stress UspA family protein
MSIENGGPKVVWAVDPFEEHGVSQAHASALIRCLQLKSGANVQPVHVLKSGELNASVELEGPIARWASQYAPAAERAFVQRLEQTGLRGLKRPKILFQTASSTSRSADALDLFAQELGADLIVVGSHGRTGMSRLLLGSFAETLLMRASVPVIVAGPRMNGDCSLDEILFPTDFGPLAKATFRRVVALARAFGSRVLIYHAIPQPADPIYQADVYMLGSPWLPTNEYVGYELERQRRRADKWARWARNQGVICESLLDTETVNIAESVVALVRRRGSGLVALAALNGPVATALLGSVTRQLVRIAECPVWVIRWKGVRRAQQGATWVGYRKKAA